jgi:hypothetical protein
MEDGYGGARSFRQLDISPAGRFVNLEYIHVDI